jgi:glycosyltransferase involved in cell wall biosynthesis
VLLRVLLLSKACVVGIYQRKLEVMADIDPNLELTLAVPPFWKDGTGVLTLENVYTTGYNIEVLPPAFNGQFHIHFYPGLANLMKKIQPHILHIDEEPYNFATFHANYLAHRINSRSLWFSWQNLDRNYPPPFSWIEKYNLNHIDYAIVGSQSSAHIWKSKGYNGPLAVIPQFGVDPVMFAPAENEAQSKTIRILFAGRLVPEKGVDLLIRALSELNGNWHALILGNGPEEIKLKALVNTYNLQEKVTFKSHIPSTDMPDLYKETDILVLPSRALPNWVEQFGRVLIEAMASGVCVVGSNTGEIPYVIGDAGLVFSEGDVAELRAHLQHLITDDQQRHNLSEKGRQRVIERFTQNHVAQATLQVYRELL